MALRAVITGDIVNSTKLSKANEKMLLKTFQQFFAGHLFEFYRGDSFQVYIKEPELALQIALLCRTSAIFISQYEEDAFCDVRVSVGIGQINTTIKTLAAAKGEAFILSGRAFDEMEKKGVRLSITTTNVLANEGLSVISDYVNAIFRSMTAKQAEVIFELLKGKTQQVVAKNLRRSKSTINQHVSAGRWVEIERLLHQYRKIINQLT